MHVAFVHTPMATLHMPGRREFWRNFDIQYHACHPGLSHMENALWELPHWMHWLGGVLVAAGYESMEVVDFYTCETALAGIDVERVRNVVREASADVYLFSPMTPNLTYALEIADCIKLEHPHSIIVFGGVVATPECRRVAAHPSVDYVIFGRGELALPALMRAIEGKQDISTVGNLCFVGADGAVIVSDQQYPDLEPNDIPFPKIDLFEPKVGKDIRYLRQVYGLGCPYKCSFCTIQTIGRKTNYFPIPRVLAEIRAYRSRYGEHHNIYWGDETFTVSKPHTLELLTALEQEGDIHYDCQTRLNLVGDPELVTALARSGCRWIEIGVESLSQGTQNLHKQRVKLSPMRDVLARLQDAGIGVCTFMVNGFPTETIDDMQRSIECVCELINEGLLQASYLFGLVPYPGSTMYEHPERFGMELLHRDFRYYHEEMPPVYRAATHPDPEIVFDQMLSGVNALAQAMGRSPRAGFVADPAHAERYGSFWSQLHV